MSPNKVINAPYTNVLYKYTIVSMDPNSPQQPAPNCKPLDPFLRVY